jgi:glycosyltransferase involved in cell wall biosynthesis
MKLSIVTINYNNAEGLRRTLASVAAQTYRGIEHIVVDGASADGSVNVIREYDALNSSSENPLVVSWSSEPDNGIYNAMNKGIKRASGDYIQILNSGDILASDDVVEKMLAALEVNGNPDFLYGNMVKKDYSSGTVIVKSEKVERSLRQYYSSTMNHDCCYISRRLYEKYGLYDESLKIVSDWKWFLQAIGMGDVRPVYVDIDVTIFDASGISETNMELREEERRLVLEETLPSAVLNDYDSHAFDMEQMDRLRRHKMYWLAYFVERVLFKMEKWGILRK